MSLYDVLGPLREAREAKEDSQRVAEEIVHRARTAARLAAARHTAEVNAARESMGRRRRMEIPEDVWIVRLTPRYSCLLIYLIFY